MKEARMGNTLDLVIMVCFPKEILSDLKECLHALQEEGKGTVGRENIGAKALRQER